MRLERFSCKTNFIKLEIKGDETPLHASSDTHKTVSTLIETGGLEPRCANRPPSSFLS